MSESDIEREIERIEQIPDLFERLKAVLEGQDRYRKAISSLAVTRRDTLEELRRSGLKPAEMAKALGVTRSRMSQLLAAPREQVIEPGPERALIAPAAKTNHEVTLVLVEKRDNERLRPALVLSTHDAVRRLERMAHDMRLEVVEDIVPPDGRIDLNRENVIVLMGPRISPVVEQVIASDPKIQWRQDKAGHWYLTDVTTGAEYHSDFDDPSRKVGTCIAHIGRIRRPDGRGSFLYLGGAHALGTSGAVKLLVRDIATLWEQVNRARWSAVVLTTLSEDGSVTVELATPIYTHGRKG